MPNRVSGLDAGAGVVEEQEQHPVSQCEPTELGQALEERLDCVLTARWRGTGCHHAGKLPVALLIKVKFGW
jgi:hypothetical protein